MNELMNFRFSQHNNHVKFRYYWYNKVPPLFLQSVNIFGVIWPEVELPVLNRLRPKYPKQNIFSQEAEKSSCPATTLGTKQPVRSSS